MNYYFKMKLVVVLLLVLALWSIFLISHAKALDIEPSQEILDTVVEASSLYEVPEELILAVAYVESGYDPDAYAGRCCGLMMIHEMNHKWLSEDFGRDLDLYDVEDNIYAGTYILAGYIQKYEDIDLALMAYNQGETSAKKSWKGGVYSTSYTRKVNRIMEDIKSERKQEVIEEILRLREYDQLDSIVV